MYLSKGVPGRATVAAIVILVLGVVVFSSLANAKSAGKTHCYNGICHRILTIAETAADIGVPRRTKTSFYDSCEVDRFNACGLTSSGEVFHAREPNNAASSRYPDGTVLLVYHAGNKRAAIVRVNSLGPFMGNRFLDVSRGTADALGFSRAGVAELEVRVLRAPTEAEARYKKNRRYAPVPGYLGNVASLDDAMTKASGWVASTSTLVASGHNVRRANPSWLALADRLAPIVPVSPEPEIDDRPTSGPVVAALSPDTQQPTDAPSTAQERCHGLPCGLPPHHVVQISAAEVALDAHLSTSCQFDDYEMSPLAPTPRPASATLALRARRQRPRVPRGLRQAGKGKAAASDLQNGNATDGPLTRGPSEAYYG